MQHGRTLQRGNWRVGARLPRLQRRHEGDRSGPDASSGANEAGTAVEGRQWTRGEGERESGDGAPAWRPATTFMYLQRSVLTDGSGGQRAAAREELAADGWRAALPPRLWRLRARSFSPVDSSKATLKITSMKLLVSTQKSIGVPNHDFVADKRGCHPTLLFEL